MTSVIGRCVLTESRCVSVQYSGGTVSGGEVVPQINRDRKKQQRKEYHEMFGKRKNGHGSGRSVRRKEEAALGGKGQ